jgi:hypothetical protein
MFYLSFFLLNLNARYMMHPVDECFIADDMLPILRVYMSVFLSVFMCVIVGVCYVTAVSLCAACACACACVLRVPTVACTCQCVCLPARVPACYVCPPVRVPAYACVCDMTAAYHGPRWLTMTSSPQPWQRCPQMCRRRQRFPIPTGIWRTKRCSRRYCRYRCGAEACPAML